MPVSALILFGTPLDQAAFDQHFENSYRPLLLQVANVEELVVNRVAGAAKGDSPFCAVVELRFASEEAMQEGLNSEAGQAMAEELRQFASGGATVLFAHVSTESPGTNDGGEGG